MGEKIKLTMMVYMQNSKDGSEAPPADAKKGKVSQKAAGKAAGKAATGAAASKAEKAAEQQRQAQLELLMMDDSALQDVARLGELSLLLLVHSSLSQLL
jgi:hypothetical protein